MKNEGCWKNMVKLEEQEGDSSIQGNRDRQRWAETQMVDTW